MTKYTLIFLAAILVTLTIVKAQPPVGDLLLYDDRNRDVPGITAYNPATGEKLELPVFISVERIETSGDGRIAYIHDNDVWVLDVLNTPFEPINITKTPEEAESGLYWNADGVLHYWVGSDPYYLLFIYNGTDVIAVYHGESLSIQGHEVPGYIGAGDTMIDGTTWTFWGGAEPIDLVIPPLSDQPAWYRTQWTPDNRLFITFGYNQPEYGQPIGPTDVFYWNGSDVQQVENPSDDETFMVGEWSDDGRLLMSTSEDYFDRWYIWDGVSFTPEGVPDTSTLMPINSPTEEIEDIEWMPDGRLAIVAEGDPETETLMGHPISCEERCPRAAYVWDFQTLYHLLDGNFLFDVHDNGSIAVLNFDGLRVWGVSVIDAELQPIFESRIGPYAASRWSADGSLAFCNYMTNLLVWDGEVSVVADNVELFATWLIEPSWSMTCSAG